MIYVEGLHKTYRVAKREKGLGSAIKSLFHREYSSIKALEDVSFTITEGEIVGYIGPNGAGKSTTIKVMSGILAPDSGRCEIMGFTPWKDRTRYVGHIGVVFGQRTQLWWDVPIIDSFDLLRDIYKVPEKLYNGNLKLLTELLSLDEMLNTPARQLSLGQRMRCEISAALLHSPKVLFLDEPTIGLDAVSKLAVRKFIKDINRERGVTVILTTHDMQDIEALADRLILIGKGKILQDAPMKDIRAQFERTKALHLTFTGEKTPTEMDGVTIVSWEDGGAVLSIDTSIIEPSAVIAHYLKAIDATNFEVQYQSIDEIIVELYKEYKI